MRSAPDIDRETWIRNALTLCWGDRSTIDAFRARHQGDVVVAAFELTFFVDPATCRPALMRSLITDVWTLHADGWRLLIRHSAPAPAAGAGVAAQYGVAPQPPPVWDASAELSFVATGGNTSTRTAGVGGALIHRAGAATTRASLAFVTSEAEAVTQARSLAIQGRHGVRFARAAEVFGRGTYGRNRFAGIDDRFTMDGGVGYGTPPLGRQTLTAEAGLGFTFEQRRDGTELRFAAATGALGYVWRIVPGTEFGLDAALVTDLDVARDWRATSTTRLTVALTRLLSLKASHVFEHRNAPVAGFGRSDTRTAAALVFSWQHRPATR